MSHYCIFCGLLPEEKTKEHVLPMWLIELTGDPKRQAKFGLEKKPGFPPREFSYDSFTVPACSECNQRFSKLESSAKTIMIKIFDHAPLRPNEISVLLDWFDKVRVGLWLAHSLLDKNYFGILPSFHVETRVGLFDRLLGIFETNQPNLCLTFMGTETTIFYSQPSCFSLVVNNYAFLNASAMFTIARRVGFPHAASSHAVANSSAVAITFSGGRERLMHPLMRKFLDVNGSYLFQPMFRLFVAEQATRPFYDTSYVHANSMDWEKGVGNVFLQKQNETHVLPPSQTSEWIPHTQVPLSFFGENLTKLVLEMQLELFRNSGSPGHLPKDQKAAWKKFASVAIESNKHFIHEIERQQRGNA